jgi:hypothetical protein
VQQYRLALQGEVAYYSQDVDGNYFKPEDLSTATHVLSHYILADD